MAATGRQRTGRIGLPSAVIVARRSERACRNQQASAGNASAVRRTEANSAQAVENQRAHGDAGGTAEIDQRRKRSATAVPRAGGVICVAWYAACVARRRSRARESWSGDGSRKEPREVRPTMAVPEHERHTLGTRHAAQATAAVRTHGEAADCQNSSRADPYRPLDIESQDDDPAECTPRSCPDRRTRRQSEPADAGRRRQSERTPSDAASSRRRELRCAPKGLEKHGRHRRDEAARGSPPAVPARAPTDWYDARKTRATAASANSTPEEKHVSPAEQVAQHAPAAGTNSGPKSAPKIEASNGAAGSWVSRRPK